MQKLTIVFAAALYAGVCSSAGWAEAAAPAPRMFTFNNGAEPETLDPALMTGVPEHNLAMSLFEGLVTYHPKTLLPAPGVAGSWKISKDKRTYTFRLRESAWSNGDPVTSKDFVYAWRRTLEPATAAEYAYQLWYIKNARAYTNGKLKDFSKVGVRAPDAQTLEVTLEHPTAFFLGLLAFETFMPVHRGCVEKHGERWTRPENIVSNGPFVLDKWLPQDRIVMRKNPRYWDAKSVQLDGVVAYAIADQNTALLRYRAGELHWIDSLPVPLVPKLMKRPDYHKAPYLGTYFYRFNCTRKPFNDARVRKAFNLALDKKTLCKFVLHGQYEPATVFVPPMIPPYKSPDGLAYDPRRAAELLAEAGYPGGRGFPRVTLLYNTSQQHEQIAVVAQNMWKKALGVEVNLINQEWKVYLSTMNKIDYDIARSAWIGDYMDPNTFLDMFVTGGGNNRTGWSNERYDKLIESAAGEPDTAKRLELFREAEDILINRELPIMPVYFYSNLSLRRASVRGFHPNPRNLHPCKYIDIVPAGGGK
ncbi:MAG: peptide ABC transporter substrate-binding protein [Planctomycetota bacterium]